MKKNVKTIMGGFLSVALLAGFISCSNGTSDETNQAAQGLNLSGASSASGTAIAENIYSGDLITFKADKNSASSSDVNLVIKYDRSAKGAKEQISLNDVELEVKHNETAISMPSTIKFELDEYSSLRTDYKDGEKETDASLIKEYKIKLPLNKKIEIGDTVTVKLNKAKVSGEGAATVNLGNVLAALIDNSEASKWYKELCAKDDEYKPLISKKNGQGLNEVETPAPANNTPENPAPANPTPENPTPATPENTSTNTNNTTPAAPTITWSESILASLDKEDKIVSGENKGVWESGTHITGDAAPYTVTHGTGWDASGMATMPVNTGSLEGFNYLLVDIDSSKFTFRDGSEQYPSFEVKVEFTDGNGDAVIINGTKCAVEGIYYIPLTKVSNVSVIKHVTFNLRGTGTLTLKDIKKAKDN